MFQAGGLTSDVDAGDVDAAQVLAAPAAAAHHDLWRALQHRAGRASWQAGQVGRLINIGGQTGGQAGGRGREGRTGWHAGPANSVSEKLCSRSCPTLHAYCRQELDAAHRRAAKVGRRRRNAHEEAAAADLDLHT